MQVMSIDPGHTVGMAIQKYSHIIYTGSMTSELFTGGVFSFIINGIRPDVVVLERMPAQNPDQVSKTVFYHVTEVCAELRIPCVLIAPGIWKPVTPKQVANPIAVHTNDALKLLHYATVINPDLLPKGKKDES